MSCVAGSAVSAGQASVESGFSAVSFETGERAVSSRAASRRFHPTSHVEGLASIGMSGFHDAV